MWLAFWSVFALCALASEQRSADEVSVFHCKFGEDWDVNYDHWPDRWVRKTGPEYPHYVEIELVDDPVQGRCLQIDLDGAGAAVTSPPIRVMSRFSYVLEANLKNERLERSTAVIALDFYDASGRLLQSEKSKPLGITKDWTPVRIESIELKNPAIERAIIGLEVIPGPKGDLQGRVSFGDVYLARLPRISVTTNNPFNVYSAADDVAVTCALSGIRERNPDICFRLLNSAGEELDHGKFPLNGQLISENVAGATATADGPPAAPAGYEGSTEWRPQIPTSGYYRIVVKILSSESAEGATELERVLHPEVPIRLAVVPPLEMPIRGEFCWSLPDGDLPLSLDNLNRLLPQVGINWVKFPAWYDATDPRRGDDLVRFVELAAASNIEVVGVIDRPPPGSEFGSGAAAGTPIADFLSPESATAWSASLEPVMSRLSLRVRWWQLGRDFDTSFAGDANVNKRIKDLRTKLFRFGQDVRLGVCWDWESENQIEGDTAWEFQQYCFSAPGAQTKLNEKLAKKHTNSAMRWVLVEPPSRGDPLLQGEQATEEQFREFVMQLISAKEHGAGAIIIPHPFNDENGLMRANGMPAELLLPWRTTAAMLGGATFLGSIQLPGGSENRIFIRPDGQVVMAVWNERPTHEIIYLGKKIEEYDILGRLTTPRVEKEGHVIEVGPVPKFVLGLHEAITRWRMAVTFEKERVPSVYSKAHANALRIHNFFPQGVGGSLAIIVPKDEYDDRPDDEKEPAVAAEVSPERWSIEPPHGTFKLARDADTQFPFEIKLRNGAMFGKQPIRIDFRVEADEAYEFSVYHALEVGTGDVTLDVNTHLNDDGVLIVEQLMANLTSEVADFKCFLRAVGRRALRSQVYQLGKLPDRKIYRFPNGKELIGREMLLEIEEVNGDRMFKYRFNVTNSPPAKESEADAKTTHEPAKRSITELPATYADRAHVDPSQLAPAGHQP